MRGLGGIRALAVLATLAASGCASLSEQDCRAGDWEAVGRGDGERGARGNELERHQKACARHQVVVNEDAWRAGYAKGLEAFCTPKGGYLAGRGGQRHHDVCFGLDGEERFRAAYGHGQDVHKLLGEIRELRRIKSELEMAALSGDFSDYETTEMRMRAGQAQAALQAREWELEELDKRYAKEYGAPPLSGTDLKR